MSKLTANTNYQELSRDELISELHRYEKENKELNSQFEIFANENKLAYTKFQLLFEQSPIGMALVDHETGTFLEVNNSVLTSTGYTREEFLGLSYWELTPQEYEEQELKQLQTLNETGRFGPNFKEYIRKDGSRYPLSISGALYTDTDGRRVVWGIIEDLSERREQELIIKKQNEELKKLTNELEKRVEERNQELIKKNAELTELVEQVQNSESKLHQIIDNIDEVLWLRSADNTRMLYINSAFEKVWGYPRETLYNEPLAFIDAVHDEDKQQVLAEFEKYLKTGVFNIKYRLVRPDGEIRWVLAKSFPVKDIAGKIIGHTGTASNITEQKKTEQSLKEEQHKLELITTTSPSALLVTHLNTGKILYVNNQLAEIINLPVSELINKLTPDFYAHAEEREATINQLKEQGEVRNKEILLLRKDGTSFWANFNAKLGNYGDEKAIFVGLNDITEQKKAEEQIKRSLREYKEAGALAHVGHWSFDPQTQEFRGSDEANRLYGLEPNSVMPFEKIVACIAPTEVNRVVQALYTLVESGKRFDEQFEIFPVGSSESRVLWSIADIEENKEKGTLLVTGILQDITDRYKSEQALKKSREQYMLAIKGSNDGIWDWNLLTNEVFYSARWKEQLGYADHELESNIETFKRLIYKDDREMVDHHIKSYLDAVIDTFRMEFRMYHKDGGYRWIVARGEAFRDQEGRPVRMAGSHTDITERKKNRELLEQNEKKFKTMLDALPLGVFLTSEHHSKVDFINQSFTTLFGFEIEDIPDFVRWTELAYPDESYRNEITPIWMEMIDKAFEDNSFRVSMETVVTCKNGEEKNILWQAFMLGDQLLGSGIDITAIKKYEKELINAKDRAEESDRLKSAFLANMSHEIRTPMNGILGFAGLLKEPGLKGEELQTYITMIEKSGARMLNIINNLVDISKIETGLMDVYTSTKNINEQLNDIFDLFKPETDAKNIQFSVNYPVTSEGININTDHEKVYSIMTNLVKNAIKYTHEGSIELGYKQVKTDDCTTFQFYVSDTGIGIPDDRLEAIFDRFTQADIEDRLAYQGAGLGLSICKAYVEMLAGTIGVESVEGKGSRFYFNLPCAAVRVD